MSSVVRLTATVLLENVSAMKFFAIMGLRGIALLETVEILNSVHLRLVPSAPSLGRLSKSALQIHLGRKL